MVGDAKDGPASLSLLGGQLDLEVLGPPADRDGQPQFPFCAAVTVIEVSTSLPIATRSAGGS